MLRHLTIENYALIRHLEIPFESGFSVITGETGAGKSIILGALSMVLGERADTQVLLDPEKKCVIEAVFDLKNLDLKSFFEAEDLTYDDQAIFRREIAPTGKSRAFINDTPVNLSLMKTLGESLVDIHSQHETLTLNESKFQLEIVDALVDETQVFTDYTKEYQHYRSICKTLETLRASIEKAQADEQYLQFLYDELDKLNLKEGEQEEMEQVLEMMDHAEELKRLLSVSITLFDGQEGGVLSGLNEIQVSLQKASTYFEAVKDSSDRVRQTLIELKDISNEITKIADKVVYDPEIQIQYRERLDDIYRLQHKHKVETIESLLEIQADLNTRLNQMSVHTDQLVALEKDKVEIENKLNLLSEKMTAQRCLAAKKIEEQVLSVLASLGMSQARISVVIHPLEKYTDTGKDAVQFLFNANLGTELRPLSKVASGGELSRLMLAIKSVINSKQILPTIIFDEIDTGVSGDIAGKVGNIMLEMSGQMQVIAITHLPQMAAKAQNHYRVFKQHDHNMTHSDIRHLSEEQHLYEIARMLSNDKVTDAAIDAAKELMN